MDNNIITNNDTTTIQQQQKQLQLQQEMQATAPPPEAFSSQELNTQQSQPVKLQVHTTAETADNMKDTGNHPLGVHEAFIRSLVRRTINWPKKDVTFLDISPLLSNIRSFRQCIDTFESRYSESGVTHIAGIDARGFTIGCALAYAMNCGFIMIRKAGKLPPSSSAPNNDSYSLISEAYQMEYGQGQLQMAMDLFDTSSVTTPRVLLIDDLLASGGTATAACNLLRSAGATVIEMAVLIEIVSEKLKGRQRLKEKAYIDLFSLLTF